MTDDNDITNEELLDLALQLDPRGAYALHEMGEQYRAAGAHDRAILCLRRAAVAAEDRGIRLASACGMWVSLGLVLTEVDKLDEAVDWLAKAVRTAEGDPSLGLSLVSALNALAACRRKQGDLDEARVLETRRDEIAAREMEIIRKQTAGAEREPAMPRIFNWEELLNRVATQPALPLPMPDEAVCVAAVSTATRAGGVAGVPVRDLHRQVQARAPEWSAMKRSQLTDYIVASGWVIAVDGPVSATLANPIDSQSWAGSLMSSGSGVGGKCYRLAGPPKELVVRAARTLRNSGALTLEGRGRLLDLCRAMELDADFVRQIDEYLVIV